MRLRPGHPRRGIRLHLLGRRGGALTLPLRAPGLGARPRCRELALLLRLDILEHLASRQAAQLGALLGGCRRAAQFLRHLLKTQPAMRGAPPEPEKDRSREHEERHHAEPEVERAMAALREMQAPPAYEPLLKTFFTVSYVALAAFVGAFADSMP